MSFTRSFPKLSTEFMYLNRFDSKTDQVVSPRGFVGVLDLHLGSCVGPMNLDHGLTYPQVLGSDLLAA